jgi:hypothetical protein
MKNEIELSFSPNRGVDKKRIPLDLSQGFLLGSV